MAIGAWGLQAAIGPHVEFVSSGLVSALAGALCALGARMAATGEAPSEICLPPRRVETILPDRKLQHPYAERYALYRALYPALKGVTT